MFDDTEDPDQIRVEDRKEAARSLMERQIAADRIKSDLCDKIRKEKLPVDGLDRKIRMLEIEDPDLFKYIRKLEFIQDGIWCPKCNIQKNVGVVRPSESNVVKNVNTNGASIVSPNDDKKYQSIMADYQSIKSTMLTLKSDMRRIESSFDAITKKIEIKPVTTSIESKFNNDLPSTTFEKISSLEISGVIQNVNSADLLGF